MQAHLILAIPSSCVLPASYDVMPYSKDIFHTGEPPNRYVCDQRAPYGAMFEGREIDKPFLSGSMALCNLNYALYTFVIFLVYH